MKDQFVHNSSCTVSTRTLKCDVYDYTLAGVKSTRNGNEIFNKSLQWLRYLHLYPPVEGAIIVRLQVPTASVTNAVSTY